MEYVAEPFDQVQRLFRLKGFTDNQIRCRFRYESGPDADILRTAVIISIEAVAILGTRYVAGGRPRWVSLESAEIARAFVVVRSEAELEAFLRAKVEDDRGPQVKVCLLDARPAAVALNMNHMVGDGAGLREYFYFLCAVYTKLESDPSYRPSAVSGDWGMRGVLDRFGARAKLNSLLLRSPEGNRAGHHSFPLSEGGSLRPLVLRRKLVRERAAALREYGRAHRANLTDILLTAFCRCLFRRLRAQPGDAIEVPVTVDLRYHVARRNEFSALANLSAMVVPRLAYAPGEAFAGTLGRVKAEMRVKRKAGDIGLSVLIKLDMLFRLFGSRIANRLLRSILKFPRLSMTNLGALDPARTFLGSLRAFEADVIVFKHKPYLQLMMWEYDGELTLGVNLYGDDRDGQALALLLEEIDAELPKRA